MQRIRRLISAVTIAALALALVPSVAFAAQRPDHGSGDRGRRALRLASRGLRALATPDSAPSTWTEDAAEDDDTPADAYSLNAWIGGSNPSAGFGKASHDEPRTFDEATNESSVGAKDYSADEDWAYFDVNQDAVDDAFPYLIEAVAGNQWVDPVVEVYGPTTTSTIDATPPSESVDASGQGFPDANSIVQGVSADNGFWWWPAGLSSSVTFIPTETGRYFVRVRPYFDATGNFNVPSSPAGFNVNSGAGPYTLRVKVGQMTRLAGDDRVKTSVALSRERFADGELPWFDFSGGDGTVVVASGYNFPDALAGSTLAGAVGGPLLLSHKDYLDQAVKDEIERLGARRVFLLGSTGALAAKVESDAADVPGVETVTRVAGTDRIKTAAAIAAQADTEYGVARLAFVVNGYAFPDALAASPMAAFNVAPILLTHGTYLDDATAQTIDDLGITDVVILGSTSAVSKAVYDDLDAQLGADQGHVQRIGGVDRYDTMKQFAVWATGDQGGTEAVGTPGMAPEDQLWALYPDGFIVASGSTYPDALGGGAFAGGAGYPMLLNRKGEAVSPYIIDVAGSLPAGKTAFLNFDEDSNGYIGYIGRTYILGGPTTLGNGVWGGMDSLLRQMLPPV